MRCCCLPREQQVRSIQHKQPLSIIGNRKQNEKQTINLESTATVHRMMKTELQQIGKTNGNNPRRKAVWLAISSTRTYSTGSRKILVVPNVPFPHTANAVRRRRRGQREDPSDAALHMRNEKGTDRHLAALVVTQG